MKTVIIGAPLAGKTTLANKMTAITNTPVYSTDSVIFRLKKQNDLNYSTFENEITKIVRETDWIIEGRHISCVAIANADKIIWLNSPLLTVIFRKIRQSGLNRELLPWVVDLIRNQYFGKLDINRIEDPTYSHNKKYSLLLKPYDTILEKV